MNKYDLQTPFHTRQYMIHKDFEIYYYKDQKLSSVRSHTHNYYEFYFFVDGHVDMSIHETKYSLHPGDIILIPPDTSHYPLIQSGQTPYRRFVLWLSRDYMDHLARSSADFTYILQQAQKHAVFSTSAIEFNTIQTMIFQLIEETKSDRFGKEALAPLLVNTLLLHLNRLIYERNHPSANSERQLYLRVCDYIEQNLDGELTLKTLSDHLFASKYHIAHSFKDNMGISIHQYILKKRLNACKNACLNGTSVTRACESYGFYDYSAFYRAFKKEYGISPKQYIAEALRK